MFALIILIYILIGLLEITSLVWFKQTKEIIVYSLLFSTSFIISCLLSLGVKIPSPVVAIENIFQTFLQ